MRVKPDQPRRFVSLAAVRSKTRQRTDGDGMVPAEDQWQLAGAQDLFHFLCELRAGSHDLAEVLQLVSRLRSRLRSLEMQVAEVAHFITELCNSLIESRYAKCRRPHVNAGHARAVPQWNAENINRFWDFEVRHLLLLTIV
jgi:hypothetical protein